MCTGRFRLQLPVLKTVDLPREMGMMTSGSTQRYRSISTPPKSKLGITMTRRFEIQGLLRRGHFLDGPLQVFHGQAAPKTPLGPKHGCTDHGPRADPSGNGKAVHKPDGKIGECPEFGRRIGGVDKNPSSRAHGAPDFVRVPKTLVKTEQLVRILDLTLEKNLLRSTRKKRTTDAPLGWRRSSAFPSSEPAFFRGSTEWGLAIHISDQRLRAVSAAPEKRTPNFPIENTGLPPFSVKAPFGKTAYNKRLTFSPNT
jgi:hypothetical protein